MTDQEKARALETMKAIADLAMDADRFELWSETEQRNQVAASAYGQLAKALREARVQFLKDLAPCK